MGEESGGSLETGSMKVLPIFSFILVTNLLVLIQRVNGNEETLGDDYQSQQDGVVLHNLPDVIGRRPRFLRRRRPYRRLQRGQTCPPRDVIHTVSECQRAASRLGFVFTEAYGDVHNDFPKCLFAYSHSHHPWSGTVFFNTNPHTS